MKICVKSLEDYNGETKKIKDFILELFNYIDGLPSVTFARVLNIRRELQALTRRPIRFQQTR